MAAQLTVLGALVAALVLALIARRSTSDGPGIAAGAVTAAALVTALATGQNSSGIAVVVGILGIVLATLGGSPLTEIVLRSADRGGRNHRGSPATAATTDTGGPRIADGELLKGGTTIGYLERFLTAGALLAGALTAVAIVVAVKGLGRFTELDSPAARERFIIGTLASLGWAALSVSPALVLR
ncbi:hypothetical protein D9V30_11640 [Mycetocola reblochoni]|uniref:Uncharacterized protein n=1 Tax=Mycetocola reblochoni TaxID=331618 RepID=A0A3L6ZJU7_9MICO|nr:hypothetical protein D9V30_11640 [Mycetocola reblochoni]